MFGLALERVINNKWISQQYVPQLIKTWNAVSAQIEKSGAVNGICQGTDMGEDADYYKNQKTQESMRRIFSIFLLIIFISFNLSAVDIVPLPYKIKTTNKKFSLDKNTDYEKSLRDRDVNLKSFYMGIRGQDKSLDVLFNKSGFFKEEFGDEGYELFIDNNKVVLAANTERGLFYGKQSLIQLIRGAKNNKLQGIHIIDKQH
ncbi:glycoside hydrolase family 88 protein [Dysgonomonas sp. Marseille-P4677]|uniref:glycoside hydrolase family 20 zincin-like fold domain-containing protein n=1 Tax=Dysgonomonas sp. Marseille-P4677 TaxID=2364790 RepID=UPI0019147AE3|nr:glycoside hydrolase family 20 zincin-like fold domain-containing protein [Dysgonomonas sp. Marseille-P4677]MBK5719842.1 glycoside hydrolase family 88 protein [Dysgonomonas sp. Marseille-P4677]